MVIDKLQIIEADRLKDESDVSLGLSGDGIECQEWEGRLRIEVENPWGGDTESGFGRSASIRLTKDDARKLRDYLTAWICE